MTEYLAEKTLDYNKDFPKLIITSAAGHTRSNRDVGPFPENHTHTHTYTTVLLLFWNLSRTTRVSRYQKGKTRK